MAVAGEEAEADVVGDQAIDAGDETTGRAR
jgi:hypothetical protein